MTDSRPTTQDATHLLMADHREVEALFAQYERLAERHEDDQKMLVAAQICAALEVHMQIEEEILYPASRQVFGEKDQDKVDEAVVEHQGARKLVNELEELASDEPMYDAKVKVLGEYITHHVGEEEREFFPALRRTSADLVELGRRLAARKQELTTAVKAGASA
jgi:iron-sulfur cluster repair protein YtfE (RIC family)